jgi:transporter family protein
VEKKILEKEHSLTFSTGLALLCAGILSPALLVYPNFTFNLESFLVIYASSILATIAFLEVTRGVRHLDISTSAPLFLLSPLITALLAFMFLGERLSFLQILGIIILGLGTYFLQTKNLKDFKGFLRDLEHNKYILYVLLGLLIYGVTSLLDKVIVSHYGVPPILSVAWMQIFIALNFTILSLIKKIKAADILKFCKRNIVFLLLASIATVGYRVSQQLAVSTAVAVSLVVAIKRSSSLFTTIIGGEIFKEEHLIRKGIACLIMLGGVILLAIK